MSKFSQEFPQASFHFRVEVGGAQLSFQEVSGLEAEMEIEEITEGGENHFKHRLPKAVKYNNLVLKRGYLTKDDNKNELIDWFKESIQDAFEGGITAKPILVHLLDEKGKEVLSWSIANAYPVKWNMSNLNAQNSEVAIETVEFAYQSLEIDASIGGGGGGK